MKRIAPLVFVFLFGCSAMMTKDTPKAPSLDEADQECIMRCQEMHVLCMSGQPDYGSGISKSVHYNQCIDVLEDCYDLCRQAH